MPRLVQKSPLARPKKRALLAKGVNQDPLSWSYNLSKQSPKLTRVHLEGSLTDSESPTYTIYESEIT